ncbi:hypothetical protein [Aliiruegeria sabulilitoris]|uniref:hypothetical protein n=1 Tax=Aliiruegeria sabulilitoris TaxID=1510458 RepID=UPI00082C8643|nr:hypothetical protein [Aliiruegeria sabulilitoris]NDR58324.1 hypothetical protein [Pseudoruegeria sp. M32A2M]
MKRALAVICVTTALLAGCDTYTSEQYQSNPQNTIALRNIAAKGERGTVGTVSLAPDVNEQPTCRLAGPIDVGSGAGIETVVKQAIQAEFLAGGIYSTNGTPVSVMITELEPDSFSGTWTIGLRVSSPKSAGYEVKQVTKFSTSFSALAACNNTADAFNRALSATIFTLVQHPGFRSLI